MSYDINIGSNAPSLACDHKVLRERYVLSTTDWKTLLLASDITMHMRAPINAKDLVAVRIGGVSVSPNDPVYGYSFVRDTEMEKYVASLVPNELFYKIQFNQPIRIGKQLIEVTYYTFENFCLKCGTLGVVTDYQPVSSGGFAHIWGENKLVQKSLKWVLTSQCVFYPNFVCPVKSMIGRKAGDDIDIQSAISQTMTKMQAIQLQQATVQKLDKSEVIASVGAVSVVRGGPNTTNISINVTAQQGLTQTSVDFTVQG